MHAREARAKRREAAANGNGSTPAGEHVQALEAGLLELERSGGFSREPEIERGVLELPRLDRERFRAVAERLGHELHLLRVDWLEGLINTAEGNREVAEAFFRDVQTGFAQAGSPFNAALVSLDWAALLLQHGDTAAAGELACEMLPIFEALEIEREVLMSLRLLTESLQRQAASVADVKDAARELGLARRVRTRDG